MPTIFHDSLAGNQHDKFQKWRDVNRRAYVINVKPGRSVLLHRGDCPHFGSYSWKRGAAGSLTKHKKVCSASRAELGNWARKHKLKLVLCNDCMREPPHLVRRKR